MEDSNETIVWEDDPDHARHQNQDPFAEARIGDHLRMYPTNVPAEIAFNAIARTIQAHPHWNPHCRKFIVVEGRKTVLIPPSLPSTPRAGRDPEKQQEILTGHFRFNLDILPAQFANGWVVGSGRSDMTNLGVDIVVTDDGERDGVRGRHVQIYHSPDRVLMLKPSPGKTAYLNHEKLENDGRALRHTSGLLIGNLLFKVQFTEHNQKFYLGRLNQLIQASAGWRSSRRTSFNPTPSQSTMDLWGYQFQSPRAAGTYGVVLPCIHSTTGIARAAKRIGRRKGTFHLVNNEISILKVVGDAGPHVSSSGDPILWYN